MKLIYIAGPFRAANPWLVEQNIRRAESVAFEVWNHQSQQFQAICPHSLGRFFDKAIPDAVALAGTLELMMRCDGVLMVSPWQASVGATTEHDRAIAAGIPVFYDLPGLFAHRWQRRT